MELLGFARSFPLSSGSFSSEVLAASLSHAINLTDFARRMDFLLAGDAPGSDQLLTVGNPGHECLIFHSMLVDLSALLLVLLSHCLEQVTAEEGIIRYDYVRHCYRYVTGFLFGELCRQLFS
jgi:hypothetical protein